MDVCVCCSGAGASEEMRSTAAVCGLQADSFGSLLGEALTVVVELLKVEIDVEAARDLHEAVAQVDLVLAHV